ncbi:MAG: hypothetical protein GXO88_14635 [Chlorobi bacterium]|nr:hypothetical protein [Chlorobiota bacterium]
MIKNISLFFLTTLILSSFTFAQKTNNSSKGFAGNLEINYSLGFSQFYGDASSSGFFKKFSGETGFAQSLGIKKHFSPVFAVGLNAYYGCVESHKTLNGSGAAVDFSLLGTYGDINLRAYVDFNNLFWGRDYKRKLSAFGWLGIGYGFWSTGLTDNTTGDYREIGNTVAGSTGGETYKKSGAVVPLGLGIKYRISPKWAVNAVGDFRTILNDDLDIWRGGFKYDQLFYMGAGISYYINPGFGKRKAKVKKRAPRQTTYEEKDKIKDEEPTTKPRPETAGPRKKVIGEVPIYDMDYKASNQAKINIKKSVRPSPDALLIVPAKKASAKGVVYRVQILAKSKKLDNIGYLRNKYNLSGDIYEVFQDGVYRYSSGEFINYQDALNHRHLLKNKGIADAFVVVYKDGKRIPLTKELKR